MLTTPTIYSPHSKPRHFKKTNQAMPLSCLKPSMAFTPELKFQAPSPDLQRSSWSDSCLCLRFHVLALSCYVATKMDFFLFPKDSKLWKVYWSQHARLLPSLSLNSFAQRGLACWPTLKDLLSHSLSHHTSLTLCTAHAIWYFLRAGILVSH